MLAKRCQPVKKVALILKSLTFESLLNQGFKSVVPICVGVIPLVTLTVIFDRSSPHMRGGDPISTQTTIILTK